VKKIKEEPVQTLTRAERMAQKMAARLQESFRRAEEFKASLDPRERAQLNPE
jgi:hypothetical protein